MFDQISGNPAAWSGWRIKLAVTLLLGYPCLFFSPISQSLFYTLYTPVEQDSQLLSNHAQHFQLPFRGPFPYFCLFNSYPLTEAYATSSKQWVLLSLLCCVSLFFCPFFVYVSLAFNALPSYSHNLHVYKWYEMLSKNYPGSHLGNTERWNPLWRSLQEWVILVNGLLSLASSSGKWGYGYYLPQKTVVKTKWGDALQAPNIGCPGYSLEGLMLKLKLQYCGHLMGRMDSLEKTLMLGKLKAGGEGDERGWDGWMASPTPWTCVWVSSGS